VYPPPPPKVNEEILAGTREHFRGHVKLKRYRNFVRWKASLSGNKPVGYVVVNDKFTEFGKKWESSVGIATCYGVDGRVRFHRVHIGSGAHSTSGGTGLLSPGLKRLEREAPLACIQCQVQDW
jgi:hypothetical protein